MNLLEAAARRLMAAEGLAPFDFARPSGEPALIGPDSVSWRVFKNPVSLFVGGVTAVVLEFAEPRVRSGVWDHSTFRTDPLGRLRRTGLAAMITVYGARSQAEAMIARVGRMHARVSGTTPGGQAYTASDPELLAWVQATAAFGFLEAYDAYVRPLSGADKDRYYAEGGPTGRLYGVAAPPASRADVEDLFDAMQPRFEPSPIIAEFLAIMADRALLPPPLAALQPMLVRAAVELVPADIRQVLGLGAAYRLRPWERAAVGLAGRLADRTMIAGHPAVEACRRLGLPARHLFRRLDRRPISPH